jgi:predicted nuclease of predicted toxin-antitoxin system
MIRLLSDENFNGDIVDGLLRRNPGLDLVRVQDVGLGQAKGPAILDWAARERRVLLTHDVRTMSRFAYERIRRDEPMPGLVVMSDTIAIGRAIEDILLLAEAGREDELENRVWRLPL